MIPQREQARLKKRFSEMLFAKPSAVMTPLSKMPVSRLCLSDTARTAVKSPYSEGPLLQFVNYGGQKDDYIYSDDPRLLKTKWDIAHQVAALGTNVDEDGRVYGNGISGSALNMLHIPGYPMYNATIPLVDNSHRRDEEGLANNITKDWHRRLYKAFFRLMLRNLQPTAIPVKKGSSSCFPLFVTDTQEKAQMVMNYLENMKKAGELMYEGDYATAFDTFHIGGAYYVLYRVQASDKVTETPDGLEFKERKVADLEYALSGGRAGTLQPAIKKFLKKELGSYSDRFGRGRKRTAFGGPLSMNAPLFVIATAARKHLYATYGFSFHHTTREQKLSKVRQSKAVIATDVSDHDMLWPWRVALPLAVDVMTEMGFAPWWITLFIISMKLPMYVCAAGPDLGHFLLGDIDQPNMAVGLPSGNAWTDLLGTANMAVVYAICQIEHAAPHHVSCFKTQGTTDAWLHEYLQGKLDIAQMSKSDDAFLLTMKSASTQTVSKTHDLLEKMKAGERVSDYMHISYEHGGAFLGDILLYGEKKDIDTAYFIGNILSYLRNLFSNEYEAYSARRPYPGIAEESVVQVYGACPVFSEVRAIVEECWMKHFGYSFNDMRRRQYEHDKAKLIEDLAESAKTDPLIMARGISDLTHVELEVLESPSKLQWKYQPEDVRESLRTLLVPAIPAEEVKPYFELVYGNVQYAFNDPDVTITCADLNYKAAA